MFSLYPFDDEASVAELISWRRVRPVVILAKRTVPFASSSHLPFSPSAPTSSVSTKRKTFVTSANVGVASFSARFDGLFS